MSRLVLRPPAAGDVEERGMARLGRVPTLHPSVLLAALGGTLGCSEEQGVPFEPEARGNRARISE